MIRDIGMIRTPVNTIRDPVTRVIRPRHPPLSQMIQRRRNQFRAVPSRAATRQINSRHQIPYRRLHREMQ